MQSFLSNWIQATLFNIWLICAISSSNQNSVGSMIQIIRDTTLCSQRMFFFSMTPGGLYQILYRINLFYCKNRNFTLKELTCFVFCLSPITVTVPNKLLMLKKLQSKKVEDPVGACSLGIPPTGGQLVSIGFYTHFSSADI